MRAALVGLILGSRLAIAEHCSPEGTPVDWVPESVVLALALGDAVVATAVLSTIGDIRTYCRAVLGIK
jgi:hypothetical protein